MLEGESWWELCALLWMQDHDSPVTQKFNRDFRGRIEKGDEFWTIDKVQISHFHMLNLL